MAQTTGEVQAEMDTEQAAQAALVTLNSTSNTAIYTLWKYITATIIVFFEEVMDAFQTDVQDIINNNQYGTDPWWYGKLLAFQYGDLLVFLNNIYQYAVIDTTKQIVGFCSINSLNGIVQIKVAANVNGQPGVLSADQLNGVISYCSQIQPSGIRFSVLSLPADVLKFIGNIYYDAAGDITVIQPAVEAAVNNYLANLNTVVTSAAGAPITKNFDGSIYVDKLINAIQAVPGIIGPQVEVITIAAKNGGSGYTDFTSSYQPESGYFIIDPDFPLANTLTYKPFVVQ